MKLLTFTTRFNKLLSILLILLLKNSSTVITFFHLSASITTGLFLVDYDS